MATGLRILGFNIKLAVTRGFEVPLDQEIRDHMLTVVFIVAIRVRGFFLKQNLETVTLFSGCYILAIEFDHVEFAIVHCLVSSGLFTCTPIVFKRWV
jgi:hypothetical protein